MTLWLILLAGVWATAALTTLALIIRAARVDHQQSNRQESGSLNDLLPPRQDPP